MVTGVAGHHGVCVTLNVDLDSRPEPGHVTTPRQGMEAKHASEVQTARKCANRSLVELVGNHTLRRKHHLMLCQLSIHEPNASSYNQFQKKLRDILP